MSPAKSHQDLRETVNARELCELSRSGQNHVASIFISQKCFAFNILKVIFLIVPKYPEILLAQCHPQAQATTGTPSWFTLTPEPSSG